MNENLEHKHVGYLYKSGVICVDCAKKVLAESQEDSPLRASVYHVNIWPYNQHCSECNKELVKGLSTWPELFE